MNTPSRMPRRLAPVPDPIDVEDRRLTNILNQVMGIYDQLHEAPECDRLGLTALIFDRFDDGVRP